MPSARKRPTPLLFYGYPVELIADWCAASRHTAYLYKIGARKPSKQALRLFVLNRDGRVYWLSLYLARALVNNDSKALEEFRRVLRSD